MVTPVRAEEGGYASTPTIAGTNVEIFYSHCSPDLEYLTVRCRPIYIPHEFTVIMVTGTYIPPNTNANSAMGKLHIALSSQQSTCPDAVHIIAGDINQADLKTVFPRFDQHINCPTRCVNTLDKNNKGYRAIPLPHLLDLGRSDHMSILLIPAYTPVRRKAPPSTSNVKKTWQVSDLHQLQDCFENTDWNVFEHQDLVEHMTSMLSSTSINF